MNGEAIDRFVELATRPADDPVARARLLRELDGIAIACPALLPALDALAPRVASEPEDPEPDEVELGQEVGVVDRDRTRALRTAALRAFGL